MGLKGAHRPKEEKFNRHTKFHSRKSTNKGTHNSRDLSTILIKVFRNLVHIFPLRVI